MVGDILDDLCTGMIILHKNLQVKYNAVIDTVLGRAAMQHSVSDEDHIPGVTEVCLVVDRQMKVAGNNADNFILGVPVIGHVIAWTARLFVIEGDREIKRSVPALLFIVNVFHPFSLSNQVNIVQYFYHYTTFHRYFNPL